MSHSPSDAEAGAFWGGLVIGGILSGIICGYIISGATNFSWQQAAIRHNAASYDEKTGQLKWKGTLEKP